MSQGVTLDEIASFVARYNYPVEEMGQLLYNQGYSEQEIAYLGQVYDNAVLNNAIQDAPQQYQLQYPQLSTPVLPTYNPIYAAPTYQ